MLAIDEGIAGYRDESLARVRAQQEHYGLPLSILSFQELYGSSLDAIAARTRGHHCCSFCGTFRRAALETGTARAAAALAAEFGGVEPVDVRLATGHNADDVAETVVMNLLRGDAARLCRCTDAATPASLPTADAPAACIRIKPFKRAYQKEIVLYARFAHLAYFSTECPYAPTAFRGVAREFLASLTAADPSSLLLPIITSGDALASHTGADRRPLVACSRCGRAATAYAGGAPICQACRLCALVQSDEEITLSTLQRGRASDIEDAR
jgi:cytoplasmic tRNA 2-thiolation protein 1